MSGEFIPYGRQWIDDDDVAAVVEVLRSDHLTTGPAVTRFEQALSDAVGGVPCVAVSSGTAALHCAYAAAGIGPGTEIVTSPLTFVATAAAAVHLGATVRFADVDDDTLCLDPAAAEAAVTGRTAAVVPVDFAGHPADLTAHRALADRHGITLIEDASHAIGAHWDGHPIGSVADLTTFSFHPVKTITTGEGGAVAVARPHLEAPTREFRNHGLIRDPARQRHPDEGAWHQEVHRFGLNYRMPDILAALGTSQLAKLDWFVQRRQELVDRYHDALAATPGLRLPTKDPRAQPAWHLFAVRILDGRRREVFDHLRASGIGAQVHYLPAHRHPAFEDLGYRAGTCPVAEAAYDELLSLPLFPGLTETDQDRVIEAVQQALGG